MDLFLTTSTYRPHLTKPCPQDGVFNAAVIVVDRTLTTAPKTRHLVFLPPFLPPLRGAARLDPFNQIRAPLCKTPDRTSPTPAHAPQGFADYRPDCPPVAARRFDRDGK